jgi:cysteine-rich repeat protein
MGASGATSYGSYEACDDGNTASGDGCSASCTIESGYSCRQAGVPCKLAVCGDGVQDWPIENCDDGNTVSGDGCDDHCHGEFIGAGGFGGSGIVFGSGGAAGAIRSAGGAAGR